MRLINRRNVVAVSVWCVNSYERTRLRSRNFDVCFQLPPTRTRYHRRSCSILLTKSSPTVSLWEKSVSISLGMQEEYLNSLIATDSVTKAGSKQKTWPKLRSLHHRGISKLLITKEPIQSRNRLESWLPVYLFTPPRSQPPGLANL